MREEDNSIFDEIEEELKHDQVLAFFKKNQNVIFWIVGIICVGIVLYSFWYSQKKQRLEITTANLFQELYASGKKSDAAIDNLRKNAPSELVPLLSIIKSGRQMFAAEDMKKNAEELLDLSKKRGLDVIWQDLAIITYVSYKMEPTESLIKRLEPLTAEDRPFRFTAFEQIGMMYEAMKNHEKALEFFSKIVDAKEAPNSMKKRISKVMNYIKNNLGGDK